MYATWSDKPYGSSGHGIGSSGLPLCPVKILKVKSSIFSVTSVPSGFLAMSRKAGPVSRLVTASLKL